MNTYRSSGQGNRWLPGTLLLAGISILGASGAEAQLRLKTFTVQPCRVLDTRLAAPVGPIPAGTIRKVFVTGSIAGQNQGGAADCAIPAPAFCFISCNPGTVGVYVNVVAVGAEGDGHVSVYPDVSPNTASTLNFQRGQTLANGVLVRICFSARFEVCGSELNIEMGPAAAHIVMDVTGYAYLVNPF